MGSKVSSKMAAPVARVVQVTLTTYMLISPGLFVLPPDLELIK